jgi:RHS repeat-associated protein
MLTAKEEAIPLLAAGFLAENSHPAHQAENSELQQIIDLANSLNSSGLAASLYDDGIWSRSTGKERDQETGLDYFGARYYGSALGRFTSPDPLMASAKIWDPQTWNRYGYVRSNPMIYVDPTGMDEVTPLSALPTSTA